MKITQEVTAWATYNSPATLAQLADPATADLGSLAYYNGDMSSQGWMRVGVATITLELADRDSLTTAAVDGLRAKIEEVKARAGAAVTELEGQINSLLALPMERSPAVDPDFVSF